MKTAESNGNLAAMVAQDKKDREEGFGRAIEAASKEWRCGIVSVPYIDEDGRIRSRTTVFAQD